MRTAGVIAEFDPFHNGHEYLLAQARKAGATHIAVAMSGAAVQRGECAMFSKFERAQAAVKCGADLVVELPAPFSCLAANGFARAGVQILVQLGIDLLVFGAEYPDINELTRASYASRELDDCALVKKFLASGRSYPAAVAEAARAIYGEKTARILSSPNSVLACEYIGALSEFDEGCDILPILRQGAEHNGGARGDLASASFLRRAFLENDLQGIEKFIPRAALPGRYFDGGISKRIMLYRLITAEKRELTELPDMSEAAADRLLKAAQDPPETLDALLLAAKTRAFTLARLRRAALALTLGITSDDITAVPYLRVLAFNERGTQILSRAKTALPIGTSLKKLEQTSAAARRTAQTENRAVRLQQCGMPNLENEYSRKISVLNE